MFLSMYCFIPKFRSWKKMELGREGDHSCFVYIHLLEDLVTCEASDILCCIYVSLFSNY